MEAEKCFAKQQLFKVGGSFLHGWRKQKLCGEGTIKD